MNYITFNDVIVSVKDIVDVERPATEKRDTIVINLSSGRTIENKYPTAEAADEIYAKFVDLFKPADFNYVATEAAAE